MDWDRVPERCIGVLDRVGVVPGETADCPVRPHSAASNGVVLVGVHYRGPSLARVPGTDGDGLNGPYTYSDTTGFALQNATCLLEG